METKRRFPLRRQTMSFYPRFLELFDFFEPHSFPLEVRNMGIPLQNQARDYEGAFDQSNQTNPRGHPQGNRR